MFSVGSPLARLFPCLASASRAAQTASRINLRYSDEVGSLHAQYVRRPPEHADMSFAAWLASPQIGLPARSLQLALEASLTDTELGLNQPYGPAHDRQTPLGSVTAPQDIEKALLLVSDYRVDPDLPIGSYGSSPLQEAIRQDNRTLVIALLKRGARDAPDSTGRRAVDVAAKYWRRELLDILTQYGFADVIANAARVRCGPPPVRKDSAKAPDAPRLAEFRENYTPSLTPWQARIAIRTCVAALVGNRQLGSYAARGLFALDAEHFEPYLKAIFVEPDPEIGKTLDPEYLEALRVLRTQPDLTDRRADLGHVARLLFLVASEDALDGQHVDEAALRATVAQILTYSSAQDEARITLEKTGVRPWMKLPESRGENLQIVDPRTRTTFSVTVLPAALKVPANASSAVARAIRRWNIPLDGSRCGGFGINELIRDGKTALHLAVERTDDITVRQLLASSGIDPNVPIADSQGEFEGWTPLQLAAWMGSPDSFLMLLTHEHVTYGLTHDGRSLLHLVASALHVDTGKLKALLSRPHNFPVDAQDHQGFTPLHWAVIKNDLDAVKLLIDWGQANPRIPDSNGWTALTYARNSVAAGKPRAAELKKYLTRRLASPPAADSLRSRPGLLVSCND